MLTERDTRAYSSRSIDDAVAKIDVAQGLSAVIDVVRRLSAVMQSGRQFGQER